jgi:hypothetical protein
MRVRRRTAGALAILASLSVAAAALAASPTKGARFKGTAKGRLSFQPGNSFLGKDPLSFTTSSSGSQLLSFTYTDRVCGLALSHVVHVGTIKVGAGGKFSVSKRKSARVPDAVKDGGTVVTTTTIRAGKFVSAKKATGTLEYTQNEKGGPASRCGPIKLKFTATAP